MNFLDKLKKVHEIEHKHAKEKSSYAQLSLAQKISASQLRQFGFELNCVRGGMFEPMAVFTCESYSVTVDHLGEIEGMAELYFSK